MADKLSWTNANGVEYSLSDNHLIISTTGLFMPNISFVEEEVPFQAGSRLRNVKVHPRDVDIYFDIQGNSENELRIKIRNLLRIFNPLIGDGKFKVIASDGNQRELYCRYKGGLEGLEKNDSKIGTWKTVVLVFRAFDPYWYDTSMVVETFKTGQTGMFFPFFPMRLSSSTVFADTTIDNKGDVETWPEWIITGPGNNMFIRNLTTGEQINLPITLLEGETAIINTRPRKKTLTKNNGLNLFGYLTDESSLWALETGKNAVRIEMSGATPNSSVQLSYQNRYLGV